MVLDLINFTELTIQFNQVQRDLHFNYLQRSENDSEHSFQLALVCWYICEKNKLELNLEKILGYSLIHDLVEIYAGDTPLYSKNIILKWTKKYREKFALLQLLSHLESNPKMKKALEDYEKQVDEESKFVKAVDKILPMINIYIDGGHAWNSHNLTIQKMYETIYPKVKYVPEVREYFLELLDLIEDKYSEKMVG